jgi:hypothetical protein
MVCGHVVTPSHVLALCAFSPLVFSTIKADDGSMQNRTAIEAASCISLCGRNRTPPPLLSLLPPAHLTHLTEAYGSARASGPKAGSNPAACCSSRTVCRPSSFPANEWLCSLCRLTASDQPPGDVASPPRSSTSPCACRHVGGHASSFLRSVCLATASAFATRYDGAQPPPFPIVGFSDSQPTNLRSANHSNSGFQ